MDIQLSQEQQTAFHDFKRGDNLFISGSGGTGKSELIRYFVQYMNEKKRKFQVTSTTGCSCVSLKDIINKHVTNIESRTIVKTIHSWSGIYSTTGDNATIINNIITRKYIISAWKRVKVLIIDEISMLSSKLFTILEELARIAKQTNTVFGGIQLICVGDFFQLPPVKDPLFAFQSSKWLVTIPLYNHIELKTIFRQKDPVFRTMLNEIRLGHISEEHSRILQKRVGVQPTSSIIPIQIVATKKEVIDINQQEYNKIEEDEYSFKAQFKIKCKRYADNNKEFSYNIDKIRCDNLTDQRIQEEKMNFLHSLVVEETISLKIGVPVMILVNININQSICNGTTGIVIDFCDNLPIVQFVDGTSTIIKPHVWQHAHFPSICLSQLPLVLAYASSIHKQQGASLPFARMNLGKNIFEDSQIYVALSRLTSLDGLYLDAFDPTKITANQIVKDFYSTFLNQSGTESNQYNNVVERYWILFYFYFFSIFVID